MDTVESESVDASLNRVEECLRPLLNHFVFAVSKEELSVWLDFDDPRWRDDVAKIDSVHLDRDLNSLVEPVTSMVEVNIVRTVLISTYQSLGRVEGHLEEFVEAEATGSFRHSTQPALTVASFASNLQSDP